MPETISFKEHFDQRLNDFKALVDLAFDASKEAIKKADTANEKRLDLLNEFRGQQADESRKYAQTELVTQQFNAITERVTKSENAVSTLQGRALALAGLGAVVGGVLGALIAKLIG